MEHKKKKSNRNRNAGNGFERTIAEKLRTLGFVHVVTTRSESRSRDGQGIDLMNKDEDKVGRLPYNIQCKNMCSKVDYHKLLNSMPKVPNSINVVFHKFTEKRGTTFHPKGQYAILNLDDFMQIMVQLLSLQKLKDESVD